MRRRTIQPIRLTPKGDYAPPRRRFLRDGLISMGVLATAPNLGGCRPTTATGAGGAGEGAEMALDAMVELMPADEHGVRYPEGFTLREIARSGEPVLPGGYVWHGLPDGGAVFAAPDGGWIYVSNSELDEGRGSVGAIRFDASGTIVDAYPILEGTSRNCAGGAMPWGAWLSCEEDLEGRVWDCDPFGEREAEVLPALGVWRHEAAAFDPDTQYLYLTEDTPFGRFYRFKPTSFRTDGYPDLREGALEAMGTEGNEDSGPAIWYPIPDPSGESELTFAQAPDAKTFRGGEGVWFQQGVVYFSTKEDSRIWAYDTRDDRLDLVYDYADFDEPVLDGVDNVTGDGENHVLVAEDKRERQQVVALGPDGRLQVLVELVTHSGSEIAGIAFDPSGTRLYFSSQRGLDNREDTGITYELTGPFFGRELPA